MMGVVFKAIVAVQTTETLFECKGVAELKTWLRQGVFTLSMFALMAMALTVGAQDRQVRTWGYNGDGELGDATIINRKTPVQISGFAGLRQIAGGGVHSLTVKLDGTVWAWGFNGEGQLGDGTYISRVAPVQVSGLTGMTQVAGGNSHSLALKSNGTVWGWGGDAFGTLGDGTYNDTATPVQVSGLIGVTQIAAGKNHSLAVKSNGTVWAWGYNGNGQLGDGTTTNRNIPVQVSGLSGVTQVAGGIYHSLALKSDGTVWAWGYNSSGQLGNGTTTNHNTPVQVSVLSGATQIAGGGAHSLALKSDGTVWAWGYNSSGQLGNGTTSNLTTPAQISGLSGATQIAGGSNHSLALKSDGTVWAWGYNSSGQLGIGTNANLTIPVQVFSLKNATQIASGQFHSLAILRPPQVAVTAASGSYGQTLTLTARLQGLPNLDSLVGRVITFSIDGVSVGVGVTNINGFAQYAFALTETLAVGSHALVASFAGDANYLDNTGSGALTALQTATTLSSVSNSQKVGQTSDLRVRLKRASDLSGLSGKLVSFSVDGIAVGTAITDATGIADLPYVTPELSASVHSVSAVFAGTSQYASVTSVGTMTVAKSDTTLPTDEIVGTHGTTVNLTALLRRSTDGSHLAGRSIVFKVDGAIVGTVTTDSNGIATLPYVLSLTVGTHKIVTSFAGDAYDNSSIGGASIIVN